jgi:hypothetical protein
VSLFFQRLGAEVTALWNVLASWPKGMAAFQEAQNQYRLELFKSEEATAQLQARMAGFWQDVAKAATEGGNKVGNALAPIVAASRDARKEIAEGEAAYKRMMAAGRATFEATLTPMERYRLELAKISQQLWVGAINAETFEKRNRMLKNELSGLADFLRGLDSAFASTFHDAVTGAKSLGSALSGLAKQLSSLLVNLGFKSLTGALPGGSLSEFFAGILGPPRAMGGPVFAGVGHMVGERGPELFVPQTNGTIISNRDLQGGGFGGRQRIDVGIFVSDDGKLAAVARAAGAEGADIRLQTYRRRELPADLQAISQHPRNRG